MKKNIAINLCLLVLLVCGSAHALGPKRKITDEDWDRFCKEQNAALYPSPGIQGYWYPPARNADGSYHLFTLDEAIAYCKNQGLSLPDGTDVDGHKEAFEYSSRLDAQVFWGQERDGSAFGFSGRLFFSESSAVFTTNFFIISHPKDQKYAVICIGPKQSSASGVEPSEHSEDLKIQN